MHKIKFADLQCVNNHYTKFEYKEMKTFGATNYTSVADKQTILFVCFDALNVPVNSYGHVGTVSSPNHTFFLGKLDKVVNQHFVHITTLLESVEWR